MHLAVEEIYKSLLQILSSNRVMFLLQPSFKLFFKRRTEIKRKENTLLYLALRFVQGKEVAFAGIKEKRIFKDYCKKLEKFIIRGTSEQTQWEERFFYFCKFSLLLLIFLVG